MITLEINDAQITAALLGLAGHVSDSANIMGQIARYMKESSEDRFVTGIAPDGTPWVPNSPATLARKKGTRPLIATGTMSQTLGSSYGRDFAEVSSGSEQAAMMQFGAEQGAFGAFMGKDKLGRDHFHHLPWGNIPARPFLGISDDDQAAILDIISEALRAAVAQP